GRRDGRRARDRSRLYPEEWETGCRKPRNIGRRGALGKGRAFPHGDGSPRRGKLGRKDGNPFSPGPLPRLSFRPERSDTWIESSTSWTRSANALGSSPAS